MIYRFLVKLYESDKGITLAILDYDILKARKDLNLEFYNGRIMDEKEIEKLITENIDKVVSINALGEKATNKIIDLGLAKKEDVKLYKGIPHLIVFII